MICIFIIISYALQFSQHKVWTLKSGQRCVLSYKVFTKQLHKSYKESIIMHGCFEIIYSLDLSKYVGSGDSNALYELYAVINHSGTLYSGHCEFILA